MKLTAKRQRFVSRYITSFNPTQAAIECGVPESDAVEWGVENLTRPDVQKALANKLVASDVSMDKTYVLHYLDKIVKICLAEAPARKEIDEDGMEVDVYEFKPSVSLKAVELVGKNLAMFTERVLIEDNMSETFIDKMMKEMSTTELKALVYN